VHIVVFFSMYLVCLDRRECRSSLDSFDQLKFGGTYRDCGQGRPGKIRGPVQNFKMRVSKLIMYIDCNILGSNQIYQEYD
jgi:hypothetical protein